jgi:hypothetical protein
MNEKEQIRRGADATRLMAEPLLQEAFALLERGWMDQMRTVDVNATDKQRNLIVMLQLLGKVKQHIEQTALTGRFAEEEAARKSWTDKFKRRA